MLCKTTDELKISTPALREEGDGVQDARTLCDAGFQPPPSARRATPEMHGDGQGRLWISTPALREEGDIAQLPLVHAAVFISTPALREEGDSQKRQKPRHTPISTPALREEGDRECPRLNDVVIHFNPRPPRGGRHRNQRGIVPIYRFQPPPSARRATGRPSRAAWGPL